ncbi:MAG: hypothetical protein ACJ8FY_03345 [Gemmataceae bacterium]
MTKLERGLIEKAVECRLDAGLPKGGCLFFREPKDLFLFES